MNNDQALIDIMDPVMKLRSEMRVRPKYRLALFCLIAPWILMGIGFGIGYWLGSPRLVSSELNRQAAYSVAVEVFKECDKLFVPEGKSEWATQTAMRRCDRLLNIALDSGYRAREKK